MSFEVQNWPAYEAGLRRRGSLTLWIEDAGLGCWQTTGPGGQARYMDAAIQTSLMLRMAFKLALRPTEGLMTSVLTLMGLTISAPDHPDRVGLLARCPWIVLALAAIVPVLAGLRGAARRTACMLAVSIVPYSALFFSYIDLLPSGL